MRLRERNMISSLWRNRKGTKDSIYGGNKVAITFHCHDTIDGDGIRCSISNMFGGSEKVRKGKDKD